MLPGLRRKHQVYGDTFFIDEVFIKIDGKQRYLWRAVDQDGEVVDVFLDSASPNPDEMRRPQSDSLSGC